MTRLEMTMFTNFKYSPNFKDLISRWTPNTLKDHQVNPVGELSEKSITPPTEHASVC